MPLKSLKPFGAIQLSFCKSTAANQSNKLARRQAIEWKPGDSLADDFNVKLDVVMQERWWLKNIGDVELQQLLLCGDHQTADVRLPSSDTNYDNNNNNNNI